MNHSITQLRKDRTLMFDRQEFYKELDTLYASHDFGKIENYLKECEWKEIRDRDNQRPGCAACIVREKEEYLDRICLMNRLTIQNELMSLYRGVDRFDESIEIAERMRKEMQQIGFEKTDQYAVVLLNEATTFEKKGDAAAEAMFAECEQLLQSLENTDPFLFASLYNNRAPMYLKRCEYGKAKADLESALQILRKAGRHKREEAVTLVSIAIACNGLGNTAEAEDAADAALALYREAGEDPHMGAALNIKAQFLFAGKKYAEAAAMFKEAARITAKYYGENGDYRICMSNAAKALELGGCVCT